MSDPDTIQILLDALTGTLRDLSLKFEQVAITCNRIEQQHQHTSERIQLMQQQLQQLQELRPQIVALQTSLHAAIATLTTLKEIINDDPEHSVRKTLVKQSEQLDKIQNDIKPINKYARMFGKPVTIALSFLAALGIIAGIISNWDTLKSKISPAPTQLTISAPERIMAIYNKGRITISWNSVAGARAYRILRDGEALATVSGTIYTDTTVSSNTTYQFQVQAISSDGSTSSASPVSQILTE